MEDIRSFDTAFDPDKTWITVEQDGKVSPRHSQDPGTRL
jgi:hypothetical protein